MFIYFDRNGVLQEVINDKAARLGDLNANEIYVYVDEVELDDIWLTLKRPDGTLSVEKSFIANKVVREIPYDPKRDMKFFKDFKEYEFYKFTITDEITVEGVYQATIRMTYEDTLSALGVLVFKAETGVIKSDQNITQAQYDYLIWYVGSWQGQIGDLEEAMGIAEADILGLQNRMNVAEQDINKIEDGTTIVGRALKDKDGSEFTRHYVAYVEPYYNRTTNTLSTESFNQEHDVIYTYDSQFPLATDTYDGLMSKEDKVKVDNIASDIASMGATKQSLSEKNQINGYAGLDANAKIPSSLLPDSVLGQLEYKGTFNPNNGYPSSPEKGWFYIAIADALISGVDYQVGDWAVYNGISWDKVDNTDAVMSVNGKLGVVVLNGTDIKVGNGDTWTIEQRIVNIYAELNNRYTKAQTYSNTEIEQRITDLLGLANLQDTAIPNPNGGFVFENDDTLPLSDISQYAIVMVKKTSASATNRVEWRTFKPLEMQTDDFIEFADGELAFDGIDFYVDSEVATQIKFWGFKLDGITADEISYDGTISGLSSTNVKTAIDELASEKADKTYVDSQDALKADKLVLTNLVPNGDFLTPRPSPNENQALGFSYVKATDISLSGGVATFTATERSGNIMYSSPTTIFNTHDTYYTFARVKTLGKNFGLAYTGHRFNGLGEWEVGSYIYKAHNNVYNICQITDYSYEDFKEIEVDYMGVINLTATFGAGNEPSKEVMDRFIQTKGFFQTTDITIKDLFNDKANKLVLTNLVSNGDLLIDSNSDGIPDGFSYNYTTNETLSDGVAKFTATAQYGRLLLSNPTIVFNSTDIFYNFARFKSSRTNVGIVFPNGTINTHSGSGNFEFISTCGVFGNIALIAQVVDLNTSDWTEIEVDYVGAINLTATFGAGNEPTKEQMDAIIKLKGYFDTTTIDIKDLMLLGFTQETRMTPTLTNATTTYLTYRKDDLGYVDIVGNLTITAFGTNLTLPEGYRPLTTLRIPVVSSTGTFGYVTINTNGTIVSNANATIFINTRFATI